jgi:hypothetical protein
LRTLISLALLSWQVDEKRAELIQEIPQTGQLESIDEFAAWLCGSDQNSPADTRSLRLVLIAPWLRQKFSGTLLASFKPRTATARKN